LQIKKEAGNNSAFPKNSKQPVPKPSVYKSQANNLSPGGAKKSLVTTKSFNTKKNEKAEKAPISPRRK
jgi:hypothetical protein